MFNRSQLEQSFDAPNASKRGPMPLPRASMLPAVIVEFVMMMILLLLTLVIVTFHHFFDVHITLQFCVANKRGIE